jgi:DNA-directed RNA polymerase specialized sigma24 family protein
MSKENALNKEAFDSLLHWLDRDREIAGQKYEKIRLRLIQIFTHRGCFQAEDLADETINRVVFKLPEIVGEYSGEPAHYFHGVANFVHLEWLRKQKIIEHVEIEKVRDDSFREKKEKSFSCLEKCLGELSAAQRGLIVDYYQKEKGEKIEHRKNLARALGVNLNVLQVRAHRIRQTLYDCIKKCAAEK